VDAGHVELRRLMTPRPAWRDPAAEAGMRVSKIETRVDLLQAYTGMTDRVVRMLTAGDERGLAVIGFGRGNVPPSIVPALADAVRSGLLVTISSRSIAGRVSPRYGYDGGGRTLVDLGAVLAGHLSGAKARLLQMVLLGRTADLHEAKQLLVATVPDATVN
jgi:L-asparaginase